MDAFAHAVESMLRGKSNPTCRLFAGEAVRLIAGNLEAVLSNGQDVSRRQHLMYAAYLAAMSVNDGSCSLGHSIAHVLGAHYHIPHGAACAITVPMTIEFFASIFPERIRALGESMGIATDEAAGPQENGIRIADAVRAMNRRTGIPTLSQLGVPRDDLPSCAGQWKHLTCWLRWRRNICSVSLRRFPGADRNSKGERPRGFSPFAVCRGCDIMAGTG